MRAPDLRPRVLQSRCTQNPTAQVLSFLFRSLPFPLRVFSNTCTRALIQLNTIRLNQQGDTRMYLKVRSLCMLMQLLWSTIRSTILLVIEGIDWLFDRNSTIMQTLRTLKYILVSNSAFKRLTQHVELLRNAGHISKPLAVCELTDFTAR